MQTRGGRGAHAVAVVAILIAGLAAARSQSDAPSPRPDEGNSREALAEETVILLHGLGRSDRSMRPLESHLDRAGYRVQNVHYPSTQGDPEALVRFLHERLVDCCQTASRLHFVTHSLGGILTRAYLNRHALPNLGRVVMLAPPNHGSAYVDWLGDYKLFEWVLGPTAKQLGTSDDSLPNRLPDADFELGVVAGIGGINPLGDRVLDGRNDGTVSVESTQLAGMKDFVEVDASHTFIMRNPAVLEHVVHFLRQGQFASEGP